MKKTHSMAMMMALSAAVMSPLSMAAFKSRTTGGSIRKPKSASYWKPNGERECARRRRQMDRSILNKANGLYIGRIVAGKLVDL